MKFYHIGRKSILKGTNGKYMIIAEEDAEVDHPIGGYLG